MISSVGKETANLASHLSIEETSSLISLRQNIYSMYDKKTRNRKSEIYKADEKDIFSVHQAIVILQGLEIFLRERALTDGVRAVIRNVRANLRDIDRDGLRQISGTKIVQIFPVLRGNIHLCVSEHLIQRNESQILYLVMFPVSKKDGIGREIHGQWGYHFHYCDAAGARRSDILLTFTRKKSNKPVTWEPHAVNKADFRAKVNRWGDEKKLSVHAACMKGKAKLKLTYFVKPSNAATFLLAQDVNQPG